MRNGTLGRLVAVTGSAMFYKPDDYFVAGPWRREPGGGPILINMIHEVDDLRSICGEIDAVQAIASSATRGFTVEDTVAIGLRFANGALGSFMLSDAAAAARSWEQTSREDTSFASYADEDCYLIAGVDGSLAVPTMRLKTVTGERSWWRPMREEVVAVERADPLEKQLDHFCAVVRGEAASYRQRPRRAADAARHAGDRRGGADWPHRSDDTVVAGTLSRRHEPVGARRNSPPEFRRRAIAPLPIIRVCPSCHRPKRCTALWPRATLLSTVSSTSR